LGALTGRLEGRFAGILGFEDLKAEGVVVSTITGAEMGLAESIIEETKRVLSANRYTDDEWSTVVLGLIAQGVEHHAAILLLIRSNLIGSAFALLRSSVEILVRGVWFTTCADSAQVKRFRDEDKIDATFGEMSDAIDKVCGIGFFHDFKERAWAALNSYTHTGILQIGRRFTEERLEPSYEGGEIVEVVRTATISILLLVRPYLVRQGFLESAGEIDRLSERLRPGRAPAN
jgi:hypothetical protein